MKKILKIATYDFKRLIINPISIVCLITILAVCMITGVVHKIEPTPIYSATISGETAKAVYSNFNSASYTHDNKSKLDNCLTAGEDYITVQKNPCYEYSTLVSINNEFLQVQREVVKFKQTGSCVYTEENNIDQIELSTNHLENFIEDFELMEEFETRLIFTKKEFEKLKATSTYFHNQIRATISISEILNQMYDNSSRFKDLDNITRNVFVWKVDSEKLENYHKNYIEQAQLKTSKILSEMSNLYNEAEASATSNTKFTTDMKNLVTSYKLTCESGAKAVELELKLALEKHFGKLRNLYHFDDISTEDTKVALAKTQFYLNDSSLYYTQYQQPLNFNTASYQVSVYDHAYFVISIIGFLTILFGIFCTYKLFGLDRRNGKIDIILSQKVSFNEVFLGKFLAVILTTSFVLGLYSVFSLTWGFIAYPALANNILAVFNLSSAYTINPFLFFLIKLIGIELQVIFYSTITVFTLNLSRKFELCFGISIAIFVAATICNIFFNGNLIYCLLPFIHADLTSFLGGATMETAFLRTSLYTYGNFFISLVYYLVVVVLLFNFTKQLFKKN